MSESKQEKAEKKSTEQLKAERQSDATADEVLKEEESGASSESKGEGRSPSPDGAFDEGREKDKAGPI